MVIYSIIFTYSLVLDITISTCFLEFDHAATVKKLRRQLDKLSSLNYNNMERSLYAYEVITADERKEIKSKVGDEKMEYLIVDIIIPSLKRKFNKKYKAFLEVMEENEDTDLQDTAKMLGIYA